jgi:hypothetical protein
MRQFARRSSPKLRLSMRVVDHRREVAEAKSVERKLVKSTEQAM